MSHGATERGETLLALARAALEQRLLGRDPPAGEPAPWLRQPGAVFVTLTVDGHLRGCVGSLEAERPLVEDLRANAVAAALRDPRFPPVTADELPRIRIEVSELSPPRPLVAGTEAEALEKLRPGVDGLILEHAGGRSTFLPQVWEQLPDPITFLRHLKRKAGMPAEGWDDSIRLARYRVDKWKESKESS